jgi:replicative DNA helicase
MMNRALLGEEDPDDILAGAEESILKIGEHRTEHDLMDPLEIIQAYEGGLNSFLDPSKRPKGISTGFAKLDEMTGGLRGGQLVIIGGRPGQGKSALGMNIAWHVATRLFQPVAVFSLEMSREDLLTRLICSAGRIDSQRFRAGYLNESERRKLREAAQAATEAPIYIDDSSGTTLMDIRAKATKLRRKLGSLGLLIVDYLQLVNSKGRAENRNNEVGAISRGLKLLSKELDTPIITLSQLSRAVESRTDKRPQLSDLRESGGIEADADLIGFIFRESVYKPDREDLRGLAELILAKQRAGPVGVAKLVWLAAQTRFENMAEDLPEEDNSRLPYREAQ